MKCIVCHTDEINNTQNGRSTAKTCGSACSAVRNSVATDEQAREKWLVQHAADAAVRAFTAPQRIRK